MPFLIQQMKTSENVTVECVIHEIEIDTRITISNHDDELSVYMTFSVGKEFEYGGHVMRYV